MVTAVSNKLYQQGIFEVYSTYHICNETSRDWHRAFGFKEEYDQLFIRLKYAWYREEIFRLQKLGLTDNIEELIKKRDYWHSRVEPFMN